MRLIALGTLVGSCLGARKQKTFQIVQCGREDWEIKRWEQLKGGRRSHAWLSSSLMGDANVQETQAAGFFPVNSSPQNPSLPLASLSVTKHICIDVAQTEVLTLTLEQGPPWKDLQAHLLLLVPGKPGHAAWGVKLVDEGVGRLRPR